MFERGQHSKSTLVLTAVVFCVLATTSYAITDEDAALREIKAKNLLAEKLMKVSKDVSVNEARYKDGQGGGAQEFDRNTGNPFKSNTTYHSYVWDYCMQWQGYNNCQKWLDPYVSIHGIEGGADQSPLEGAVGKFWQQMKKPGDTGAGGSYGIWDVKSKGQGSVLDEQGKLDRSQLTKFVLKKDVAKSVEQIGYDTATKAVGNAFDENAQKNDMPNMESLRLMAGRYTRMYRNRMVANVGELRAADKGIEFSLGEDSPDCSSYLQWMKTDKEETKTEDRLQPQAQLDFETRTNDLKKRYEMCMKVRNAPINMVNAKMVGDKVSSGGKDSEQIDKWRSRAAVATVDYGGIDPNDIPKPSDAELTEDEVKSKIGEWKDGGMEMTVRKETNGKQFDEYNKQLQEAAQGMKEVSARSPFFADASDQILENQIQKGSKSLVEVNGLTKEMKLELQGTKMPHIEKKGEAPSQPNPDKNLEQTPSQLTFTSSAK